VSPHTLQMALVKVWCVLKIKFIYCYWKAGDDM